MEKERDPESPGSRRPELRGLMGWGVALAVLGGAILWRLLGGGC